MDESEIKELKIQHISQDDYHNLVSSGKINNETIYLISSETLNLYGEQIKNLAPGNDLSDAVNLEQLTSAIISSEAKTNTLFTLLNNEIKENNISLSNKIDSKITLDSTNIEQLNIKHIS
jgi:hypothetical protein